MTISIDKTVVSPEYAIHVGEKINACGGRKQEEKMKKRTKFRLAVGAIVLIMAMCDPLSTRAAEGISGDFEF